MKRHVTVWVYGRVHGVFFRSFVRNRARLLGLKGWVKNTSAGVEAVFEGDDTDIDKMIGLCRKGPDASLVESIDVKEGQFRGDFRDFEIR